MRAVVAAVLAVGVLASPVAAQLARRGDTVVVSDVAGTKRLPALAFDPVHGRWLVVWSLFPVAGRILSRDGTPLGAPFSIAETNAELSLAPRVTYAPAIDAFLVTWIEDAGGSRIEARLLRADDTGVPTFLSGDVVVADAARPKHPESSPSVGWSEASRTFVVTWADVVGEGDIDVWARRLDASATPLGEELLVSGGAGFDAFPVLALSIARDAFLVAWSYEGPAGGGAIAGRTVGAADGALGEERVLYSSAFENYPDITYDDRRDRFLVASYHIDPGPDVVGRLIDGDGTPLGDVIPIAAGPDFEGGDGIGVAYNRAADSFVAVYQSTTMEIWASPVSGEGVPGTRIEATSGARMGSYAPRIAADPSAPLLRLTTSYDFDRIAVQALELPAVIEPDAGIEPGDAGDLDAGIRDASGLDAPGRDVGARPGVASGCGCRAGTSEPPWPWALSALVVWGRWARARSARARASG